MNHSQVQIDADRVALPDYSLAFAADSVGGRPDRCGPTPVPELRLVVGLANYPHIRTVPINGRIEVS